MFQSIIEDIKTMLRHGNMLTRLILWNILAFVLIGVIIRYLFPSFYPVVLDYLAISSDLLWNLKHPWVFITHLFLHAGFYHIFWNLLLYYWFGTIVGDLVGDEKILPLFIYGGLMGAVIYMVSYHFLIPYNYLDSKALGASAAIMATVVAAALIAPDYKIRLLLIGPVSIKYIVLFLLILDLIGTTGTNNTGGHFAHLGGALMGWIFVANLKRGNDLGEPLNRTIRLFQDRFNNGFPGKPGNKLRISHKNKPKGKISGSGKRNSDSREKIDQILDKINEKGYDQLTDEEKETLFQASKKKN